jgi:hypothetical protein
MMKRTTAVVAVVALLLGLVIGSLATRFLWKPSPSTTPSRSAYVVNQLNVVALLSECKPADAKFLVAPAGSAEEDRYGFHGFYTASWTDSKDAGDLSVVLEKKLRGFIESKGCQFSRTGQNESLANPDFQEWMMQFDYHHPDWSVGGRILIWIHHEQARKWSVVLSYNAAHDPARQP